MKRRKNHPWSNIPDRILFRPDSGSEEYNIDEYDGSMLGHSLEDDGDDHISCWLERATASEFRNRANWTSFVQGDRSDFFRKGIHRRID